MSEVESADVEVNETEALQHAMIEHLMGVIGAPDDVAVADAADGVVRALDARLSAGV